MNTLTMTTFIVLNILLYSVVGYFYWYNHVREKKRNQWNCVKKKGLPPPNKPVIVTSGDCTIMYVAEWYIDEFGKTRWQCSSPPAWFIPEHHFPTHWINLPDKIGGSNG